MGLIRFLWHSVRIPSKQKIAEEARQIADRYKIAVANGSIPPERAALASETYFLQRLSPLVLIPAFLVGLAGNLLAGSIAYFVAAPLQNPTLAMDLAWAGIGIGSMMLIVFFVVWANQIYQRFTTIAESISEAIGARRI